MPKALTPDKVLQRAKALVDEAADITLPESGQKRGQAVRKIRSLLSNADKLLRRISGPVQIGKAPITEGHKHQAEELENRIEELWPEVLCNIKRKEQ